MRVYMCFYVVGFLVAARLPGLEALFLPAVAGKGSRDMKGPGLNTQEYAECSNSSKEESELSGDDGEGTKEADVDKPFPADLSFWVK